MGTAKQISKYGTRYQGSLTEDLCQALEQVIESSNNNDTILDLVHCAYLLSDSDVNKIVEETETFGRVISDIDYNFATLYPYQTTGVPFMFLAKNCILGDSTGMGKTIQVAGLCNILESFYQSKGEDFNYLYLTEKKLVDTKETRNKMIKYTGKYIQSLGGDIKDCRNFVGKNSNGLIASIVGSHSLINQGLFIEWLELQYRYNKKSPFKLLVVDESSIFGNPTNLITKNLKTLKKYFERVIFMNATPFESDLMMFYNQLSILDSAMLPVKSKFSDEYIVMKFNGRYNVPTNKYKNGDVFKEAVAFRYLARTRKDTGAVIENNTSGVIISPLSKAQKELLVTTNMKQMVYDCPNYIDSSIAFNETNVPKLGSLRTLLEEDFEDMGAIMVFCVYKEAQYAISDWLAEHGYSNCILNGDTKTKNAQSITEGFRNGEFKVLITNTKKGFDFGHCDVCIYWSIQKSPGKMQQVEGRTTRDFDIIGKNVRILCSKGSEYKSLKELRDIAMGVASHTTVDYSGLYEVLLKNKE